MPQSKYIIGYPLIVNGIFVYYSDMDKLPEDYWIGRGADLIGKEILEEGDKARQAPTYQAIAGEICLREFDKILDIGCNVAALKMFLIAFDHTGVTYFGLDTNPHAVEHCKARGLNVALGGLRKLNMPDQSFPCVVIKDVLEHLESLEPAREAFRVASEAVILSFFMAPRPGSEFIERTEAGYFHNRYDELQVVAIAESCGFSFEKRIDTFERGGPMNRTYVFVRG